MKIFEFDVVENTDFQISKTGVKTFYNLDNVLSLSEWMEHELPKNDTVYPVFESALGISQTNKKGCSIALGYINNDSNNVQQQNVIHLMSGVCKANGNKPITKNNFEKMIVGFTARKIIKRNWLVDKDEFMMPNTTHSKYNQFKLDSVIYSIFHIHSFQSSLRQVDYLGQQWNVKNEFFWMSVDKMRELSEENNYDDLFNDVRTDSNRYVYNLLFGEQRIYDKLSPDAKAVLDYATSLVEQSMEFRKVMANDDNHLDAWDAGYAQLKLVWKEYFPNQFKEFRELYKKLEDSMRPLVYELGFLVK